MAKHGIDFVDAQQLWRDDDLLELPARSLGEQRFAITRRTGEKIWSAVITYRNEEIRIISVRRPRRGEESSYFGP